MKNLKLRKENALLRSKCRGLGGAEEDINDSEGNVSDCFRYRLTRVILT